MPRGAPNQVRSAAVSGPARAAPLELMRLESMSGVPVPAPDKVIAEIVDQIMVPLLTAR
jgi:hypothetical protein